MRQTDAERWQHDRLRKTRIGSLHRRFGKKEAEYCGNCDYYETGYCNFIADSHWNSDWQACGKFKKEIL